VSLPFARSGGLSGVQDDLGVAVAALVEFVVRVGGPVQGQLVRDDPRRPGLPADDQVTQFPVVPLDRALARADGFSAGR